MNENTTALHALRALDVTASILPDAPKRPSNARGLIKAGRVLTAQGKSPIEAARALLTGVGYLMCVDILCLHPAPETSPWYVVQPTTLNEALCLDALAAFTEAIS